MISSVLAVAMLTTIGFGAVSADESDKISKNEQKIQQFREQALADGNVPISEILERLSPHWVEKYDSKEHFTQTQETIHKFIDRNRDDTNSWNAKNAILHLEIQNFETITGVVGQGHAITLHAVALAKLEGNYKPTEPIKKYHTWLETMYTVPTDKEDIVASLVEILGDAKYVDLAMRHAANFNQLADNGSVPADLVKTDVHYWIFVANTAQCELNPDCDVSSMGDGEPATQEEIAEIERIERERAADSTFNPFDYILPKAYAWSKVYVDYDLYAYLNATTCYYNNCVEDWDEDDQNGSGEIDVMNYDTPAEHAYSGATMYFYGSACDTHSGSENVINEVVTTPYLANELRTQYETDRLNINSCATASTTFVATADWILGILVESPGSYYWVP